MTLSLYLHYPFCANRCSYCDFYKELHEPALEKAFYRALKTETELALNQLPPGRHELQTIFIGGGTPSLANLGLLGEWLHLVRSLIKVSDWLELSVETNPESVSREVLAGFKALGVNRPLFGIQSFNQAQLRLLNRIHNPDDSHRALYLARALRFDNYGVDLIFGLPSQTGQMLADDVNQVIDLAPPHISFYQLAVEEGTPLAAQVAAGEIEPVGSDLAAMMFREGCSRFREAGYTRYEISSFAMPGCQCRHNLTYWQGGEYLGLGPSAHSFVGDRRFANQANLGEYVSSLEMGQLPRLVDESGEEQRMNEAIMLGLRLTEGITHSSFLRRFGVALDTRLDMKQCEIFAKSDHLVLDDAGLRLTEEGLMMVDEITRRLLP